jgi:hypothetical protein
LSDLTLHVRRLEKLSGSGADLLMLYKPSARWRVTTDPRSKLSGTARSGLYNALAQHSLNQTDEET